MAVDPHSALTRGLFGLGRAVALWFVLSVVVAGCADGGAPRRDAGAGSDLLGDVGAPDDIVVGHDTSAGDLDPRAGDTGRDSDNDPPPGNDFHQWVTPLSEQVALRGMATVAEQLVAVGGAGSVLIFDPEEEPPVAPGPPGAFLVALAEPRLGLLNAVAGAHHGEGVAVGLGGLMARRGASGWQVPDLCHGDDARCAPGDPCRRGTCGFDGWCRYDPLPASGCCGTTVARFDFDGAPGEAPFDFQDLYDDVPESGGLGWQEVELVVGPREAMRATSAPGALYFGDAARSCRESPGHLCPGYGGERVVGGRATSPPIGIPAGAQRATLLFDAFVEVEASPNHDILKVEVVPQEEARAALPVVVWTKAAVPLGTTGGRFETMRADLSPFRGTEVRLAFVFDSRTAPLHDHEGVYLDSVRVVSECGPLDDRSPFGETLWGVAHISHDAPETSGPAALEAGDYLAVGRAGTILRGRAGRFERVMGGAAGPPAGIHGSAADDIHVVGRGGYAVRRSAEGVRHHWLEYEEDALAPEFTAVWVESASLALAVGEHGAVFRGDTAGYKPLAAATTETLRAVHGSGARDALVVGDGGVVLHFDGDGLAPYEASPLPALSWRGVWRRASGDTWLAGVGGALWREIPGRGFAPIAHSLTEDFVALRGFTDGSAVAAADDGHVLHIQADGGVTLAHTGLTRGLMALHGSGPSDLWAAGAGGELSHYDGTSWRPQPSLGTAALVGLFGPQPDSVWAVARDGALWHYDGRSFEAVHVPTTETLRAVWAAGPRFAVAVGGGATIRHFDGVGWRRREVQPVALPGREEPWEITKALHAVWGAAPDDVWAVGAGGVIVHWDGVAWRYVPSPDERLRTLWAIWGRGADEIFAAGAEGVVLRFDGGGWRVEESGTSVTLEAIAGLGARTFFAGGRATVLEYLP